MNIHYDDLVREILDILPNAQFGDDNDGQLIIYTGLVCDNSEDFYMTPTAEYYEKKLDSDMNRS